MTITLGQDWVTTVTRDATDDVSVMGASRPRLCTCKPVPDDMPDILRWLAKLGCTVISYEHGWLTYIPAR
jgi:hypothetical protein